MSKMSEIDADRQQIERLTDIVPPPSFAESARAGAPTIAPTPWELVEANEHHGAYIVNAYGADVCDCYAMSNPMAASVRNGGNSFPVPFTNADANAAFIVKAVNNHDALVSALTDALCELTACATQLAARGLKGREGDSVSRAQIAAREALAAVRESRQ